MNAAIAILTFAAGLLAGWHWHKRKCRNARPHFEWTVGPVNNKERNKP